MKHLITMAGSSSQVDTSLITDLCEMIERDPSSVETRKMLASAYEAYGWTDAAADEYTNILAIEPGDPFATSWLLLHANGDKPETSPKTNDEKVVQPSKRAPTGERPGVFTSKLQDFWNGMTKTQKPSPQSQKNEKPNAALQDLGKGYQELMSDARNLLQNVTLCQSMFPGLSLDGDMADLKAISKGRLRTVVKIQNPPSARALAAKIKASDHSAVDTIFDDLDSTARWLRAQDDALDNDKIREALRKRTQAIKAALPVATSSTADQAFMHIEHELLSKKYQNEGNETMLGDEISDIPRSNFWVSDDGFAWDMSELAGALKANSGVMRNPLSKQMFTADDVRAIVRHPLGKNLAALQLEQKQLTNGVRPETITRLAQMAGVLLEDQSADATVSREAVDGFLSFLATLPDKEQNAIRVLRVPATDSHTGRPFDVTIGDAVADAKANRQCFHKTGDMLRQAASYLRTNSKK